MPTAFNRQIRALTEQPVSYMGIPYLAKELNGTWYFKDVDDEYRPFVAQDKIKEQTTSPPTKR